MSWMHLDDTIRKARKRWVCELCGQSITAGSNYVSRHGIYDGEFVNQSMHVECEALTQDWDIHDWECHMIGSGEWPKYDERGKLIEVEAIE